MAGDAGGQTRAEDTTLDGLRQAGIGEARGGEFRLFERSEYDPCWDPIHDVRPTVWEATQHLVAALERSESEAGDLLARLRGGNGDRTRQLAYLLFHRATEKGWSEEAGAYNALINAPMLLAAVHIRNVRNLARSGPEPTLKVLKVRESAAIGRSASSSAGSPPTPTTALWFQQNPQRESCAVARVRSRS